MPAHQRLGPVGLHAAPPTSLVRRLHLPPHLVPHPLLPRPVPGVELRVRRLLVLFGQVEGVIPEVAVRLVALVRVRHVPKSMFCLMIKNNFIFYMLIVKFFDRKIVF